MLLVKGDEGEEELSDNTTQKLPWEFGIWVEGFKEDFLQVSMELGREGIRGLDLILFLGGEYLAGGFLLWTIVQGLKPR